MTTSVYVRGNDDGFVEIFRFEKKLGKIEMSISSDSVTISVWKNGWQIFLKTKIDPDFYENLENVSENAKRIFCNAFEMED